MKKQNKVNTALPSRKATALKNAQHAPHTIMVLMSMPQTIHNATAVLDMPDDYANRLLRGQEIINHCTGNTYVTIAAPVIAAAQAKLDAYAGASNAAEREAYFIPFVNAMKSLMRQFQDEADQKADIAIVIIESGSFKVKHVVPRQRQDFEVTNGILNGTAELTAPASVNYCCHDWHYSTDGVTFIRATPTVAAHTQITNLPSDQVAFFTHELITKDGPQGPSQVLQLKIN